jgi:hypothetical protein
MLEFAASTRYPLTATRYSALWTPGFTGHCQGGRDSVQNP